MGQQLEMMPSAPTIPDPIGPELGREELFRELSQLSHGITQLGTYTLDRDSLCVIGECLHCSCGLPQCHVFLYQ